MATTAIPSTTLATAPPVIIPTAIEGNGNMAITMVKPPKVKSIKGSKPSEQLSPVKGPKR